MNSISNSLSATISTISIKDTKIPIKLQKAEHFQKWAFLLRNQLKKCELWDDSAHSPIESPMAFSIIVENLHEDSLDLIMDIEENQASVAWNKLKSKFAGKSIFQQRACISALVNFRMSENMQQSINQLRGIARTLKAA